MSSLGVAFMLVAEWDTYVPGQSCSRNLTRLRRPGVLSLQEPKQTHMSRKKWKKMFLQAWNESFIIKLHNKTPNFYLESLLWILFILGSNFDFELFVYFISKKTSCVCLFSSVPLIYSLKTAITSLEARKISFTGILLTDLQSNKLCWNKNKSYSIWYKTAINRHGRL